jgi:clan AA aspartic protease
MGQVFANLTLKNSGDVLNVRSGRIKAPEIRQTAVRALVDTGAGTLVINEWLRVKLGLEVLSFKQTTLGDNTKIVCKVAEPVEIHWNDRSMTCRPLVIPGDGEVLLGVIPLEDMDLMVNPVAQELVGAHGDEPIAFLK